ncbi:MAG: hypothetical protein K2P12_00505, partial [Clostridia bacterium]|nr:hypothetical protein [Clostridia bacterium]
IMEMHNGKVINDWSKEEYSQKEEKNNQGKEQCQEELLNIEIDCNIKKERKENTKLDKKQTKIGSKSIFSYKKGKNVSRKKQGLSLNSICGLTIAFNNKGIAKKVILSLICAVMIGLILASTSMIFSSYEYTLYRILKNSEDKLLSLDVDGGNDNIGEEVAQFISNECGIKVYKTYNKFRVSAVYDLKKIDESPLPPCYEYAFVNGIGQLEVFIDKPEDLGIKMLYGRAPVERNEIAISKTNLDYWLYCKDFVSYSTGEAYHFESVNDIIGKKNFNGSSLTIVGVFDDRNRFNNMDWTYEEIYRYEKNNLLYNTVIRPESIAEESKFFDHNKGNSEGYHFTADKYSNDFKDYASFMPLNQPIFDYYNDNKLNNYTLKKDEIVIADSNFIDKMNERGRPLKVGDKIELSYVKTKSISPRTIEIEDEYFTKTYKIVGIEKDSNARCIFINEQEYLNIYKPFSAYSSFLFSGENLSLNNLRKISNKYRGFLMLNNLYNIDWDDTEYIIAANSYIAIPIFILAVFILVVLLSVIVSDIVKIKGREVLILKSCGAKQIDILKVFSVNLLAILFAQIIVGIIFGFGILSLFNYVFKYIFIGEEVGFNLFWIGAENIFLSIAGIVFVSIIAIYYSMRKLNGKNLRKSFQKQKR